MIGYSGLRILARPTEVERVRAALTAMPALEVHAVEADTGLLVVVQEGATVEEHQAGLRAIQAVPGVLTADLVCHFVDDGGGAVAGHQKS